MCFGMFRFELFDFELVLMIWMVLWVVWFGMSIYPIVALAWFDMPDSLVVCTFWGYGRMLVDSKDQFLFGCM